MVSVIYVFFGFFQLLVIKNLLNWSGFEFQSYYVGVYGGAWVVFQAWSQWIFQVIFSTLLFLLGQNHFRALRSLKDTVNNYDIRNASLSNPADRDFLLTIVDDLFKRDAASDVSLNQRANSGRGAAHNQQEDARLIFKQKNFNSVSGN